MHISIVMNSFVRQQVLQLLVKPIRIALVHRYKPNSKPTQRRQRHGSPPLPRLWSHRPCPVISSSSEHVRADRLLNIPSLDTRLLQTSPLQHQLPPARHPYRSTNVLRSSGFAGSSSSVRLRLSLSASQQL